MITGGLGFIGRHLTSYLFARHPDCSITIVDNLSGSEISKASLESLSSRATIEQLDLLHYCTSQQRFDDIYHLASPVGAIGILNRAGNIAKSIVDLATKVAEVANQSGAKLMYLSSSEIYYATQNQTEDVEITLNTHHGARIEYAIGKYAGEVLLRNHGIANRINYNICRPFNLIGEQQSSKLGFVVPRFFEACFANQPLEVFGDGNQLRSFCDVEEFVKVMVMLQESEISAQTVNIGNVHNRISINALAEKIRELTNSNSVIYHVDPIKKYGSLYMEGGQKLAHTKKAEALLGIEFKENLIETLARIHQSYKSMEPAVS